MPQSPRMKNKEKNKKRGSPKDDDSVDEKGNVKDLIDYDYDEDADTNSEASLTKSEIALAKKGKLPTRLIDQLRKPRKAALLAAERIRKTRYTAKSQSTKSSDSTFDITESEDEEDEEEEEPVKLTKKSHTVKKFRANEDEKAKAKATAKATAKAKAKAKEEEEEEEEEDEDEEDEEEEDDEDEDEDDDYEDQGFKGISISFGGDEDERMVPKRHNMKKESADVQKFVKLVTNPIEEENIDDQIDQFKSMDASKQRIMLEALEKRSEYVKKEQPLMFRLLQMSLKPETMGLVMNRYNAMNTMDPSSGEYYKLRSWMEKLVSIPLGVYKQMPVRIEEGIEACSPFMEKAKKCLNEAIYGQEDAKLQILQFIASKIANPTASGLSLLLLGPPGIGKTSLIKNGIAKALEWPFQFISLGGDSDATTYTGHQFVYEGSHSGKIANCLAQAKSMSMIMMFDELDKISNTPKGEEVQNLLVHLTDPVQNMDFEDKYLSGIPLDLSRAMFVFSGNDVNKIDRILLDRMVVVNLNGYEVKDKVAIAEQFLLPAALREVNLVEKVAISREIIQHILENYAKEETGVRELKRCLEQIAQRVNMLRMFNVKELPFHIPNFSLPFVLKKEHVDLFLKKSVLKDKVPYGMYI